MSSKYSPYELTRGARNRSLTVIKKAWDATHVQTEIAKYW